MKLAVVALPNEMKCEVVPREGQATPQIVFIGRTKQVAVLAGLFLCALALVGTTYFATSEARASSPAPLAVAPRLPAPEPLPAADRPMVRQYDGSKPLKAGDMVILKGSSAPKVRQIAAAPNQGVLLRRGQALHALYVTGDKSYVVISDKDSRIVGANDIRATIPPMLATAAR